MSKEEKASRREFLKTTAAATAGVTLAMSSFPSSVIQPVLGANDKIRMGFIGVGNRGTQLMSRFMANKDVQEGK